MSPGKRHTFHRPATILCQPRFDRSNELRKAASYRHQRNEPATAWHIAADDWKSTGKVLVQLQAVTVGREPVLLVRNETDITRFHIEGNLLNRFRTQVMDVRPPRKRAEVLLTVQILHRSDQQERPVRTMGCHLLKQAKVDSRLHGADVADHWSRYLGDIVRNLFCTHRLLKERVVHAVRNQV